MATRARVGPGTTLGRYFILRELGHGAMGSVYGAYDPQLDGHPRIRWIRIDLAGALEGQGRLDEARVEMWRVAAPTDEPEAAKYVQEAERWLAEHPDGAAAERREAADPKR